MLLRLLQKDNIPKNKILLRSCLSMARHHALHADHDMVMANPSVCLSVQRQYCV